MKGHFDAVSLKNPVISALYGFVALVNDEIILAVMLFFRILSYVSFSAVSSVKTSFSFSRNGSGSEGLFFPSNAKIAALRLQRDSSHLQITEIHTAISIQSVVN